MDNDYNIFKYINPSENLNFSQLSDYKINQLINLLSEFDLEFRHILDISKQIKFGMEFEVEEAYYKKIMADIKKVQSISDWNIKDDKSLFDGLEISTPILKNDNKSWKNILSICSILQKHSEIGENCGAHIHIGAQILQKDQTLLNLALLWITYENIIFRFCFGEYINERANLNTFSKPIAYKWYQILKDNKNNLDNLNIALLLSNEDTYRAVNTYHIESLNQEFYYNTIEFRLGNGTLSPVIWQNYLNLYVKIINYCKDSKFNYEVIQNRLCSKLNSLSNLVNYRKINIAEALEFSDLVFNNNLDKIYFLRQYLKDGTTTSKKELVLSRTFIKK